MLFKKSEQEVVKPNIYEQIDEMFESLDADIITLHIGSDLVNFGEEITDLISKFRKDLKDKNGFIFPPVHVLDDKNLQENQLIIYVRGLKIYELFVVPTLEEINKEITESMKYIYNRFLDKIFTYQITEKYINFVQQNHMWTTWNLTSMYSVTEIRSVLKNLLEENRSIKNINYVFEKFADCALESGFSSPASASKITKHLINVLEPCD